MKHLVLTAAALGMLSVAPDTTAAQLFDRMSNPKVTVTINHPPGLGLPVNQLAFGPATGRRSDEIVDALQADFVRSGMRVLDRRNLQNTLAEHQLNYGGYVDQQTAVQMGKFLGATAMIVVDVSRAATERQPTSTKTTDSHNVVHTTWHSRTKAYLKVSLQTIDLKTGQLFQAEVFDRNAEMENTVEETCCAEYPSEFRVFDLVVEQVVGEVHRLFLVWSEPQQLYFFADKDCRMNLAYDLLKSGDTSGADRQSAENIETCRSTPNINDKQLAHSYYNVGLVAFLEGKYAKALDYFEQAQKVKDIGITTDAMTQLRRAKQASDDLRAFEARRAAALNPAPAAATGVDAVATAPQATAKDSASPKGTPAARLKALNEVYQQGLITKAEYEKKKAEILRDM